MKSELENILSSSYKNEMISFLKSHPQHFDEAIQLAILDKQPFSWRAAFVLASIVKESDKRTTKHIKSIVKSIPDKKDGHQRELLKILYKMELNEKYEGEVFDICMNLWEQISKSSSVRMIAFKFILKTVEKHPELLEEIKFLTEEQYLESLSPAVKKAIEKMINEKFEK